MFEETWFVVELASTEKTELPSEIQQCGYNYDIYPNYKKSLMRWSYGIFQINVASVSFTKTKATSIRLNPRTATQMVN